MRAGRILIAGFDRFLAVPRAVAAALILLGIGLNFANVVGRYLFSAPIPWAEEVMIFGMIWIIFLGAALAERDNEHLRIDLLQAMLSPALRRAHHLCVAAIVIAVCAFVAWQSFEVTSLFAGMGDQSAVAGIPKWLMHGAITVGLVLVLVSAVAGLRSRFVESARSVEQSIAARDRD